MPCRTVFIGFFTNAWQYKNRFFIVQIKDENFAQNHCYLIIY